jgi:hypothetical protein
MLSIESKPVLDQFGNIIMHSSVTSDSVSQSEARRRLKATRAFRLVPIASSGVGGAGGQETRNANVEQRVTVASSCNYSWIYGTHPLL